MTCPEQSLFAYLVLQRLDVEKETIELVHTKPTETQELQYRIPTDSPRYHFFIFKHSHQGQLQEALGQCTLSPWCYNFIETRGRPLLIIQIFK